MGMTMQSQAPCPRCKGKGKIIAKPCDRCKGKGKIRVTCPKCHEQTIHTT